MMVLAYQAAARARPIPISEASIKCASSGRNRELVGKKCEFPKGHLDGAFFVLPAARLPWLAVMLVIRYSGKPNTCWINILMNVTIGVSSVISSS